MKRANIAFFVPHRGCPFQCVFCDQKKISGSDKAVNADTVQRDVRKALLTLGGRPAEIAFFGGSFTGIPVNEQEELLSCAYEFVKTGEVEGIRLSTRPDFISETVLDRLARYGVTAIELGAQSMDDRVLAHSGRGHRAKDVTIASQLIRERGFSLGLQMMTGLPEATWESDQKSAQEIIALFPDTVRIYPTLVLSGTLLCEMYERGEYQPQSLEEAVESVARIKEMMDGAGVRVIRMGLHSERALETALVKGPYHPAFGELVASRMIYHRMEHYIKTYHPSEVILTAPERLYSQVMGQKRENIQRIEQCFGISCRVLPSVGDAITINGNRI